MDERQIKVGDKFRLHLTKETNGGIPEAQNGIECIVIFVPPDLAHELAEFSVDTGYHYPWAVKVSEAKEILRPL